MAGLCINPNWNPAHTTDNIEMNPYAYRSIVYQLSEIPRLLETRRPLFLTINNECAEVNHGGAWQGWDSAIQQIAQYGPVHNSEPGYVAWVGIGNEFDAFWTAAQAENPPREDVPPEFAAELIRRASPVLRAAGILVVATSVVSPSWPEYLSHMIDLCRDAVDYVDIHPYGQRPDGWESPGWGNGELRQALAAAASIAQRPVVMSEVGITIESAEDEDGVAEYMRAVDNTVRSMGNVVPGYWWFAYRDQIGAPDERGPRAFGLLREDASKRPAYHEFVRINAETPAEPEAPHPDSIAAAQAGGQTIGADALHAKRWMLHAMPPLTSLPPYHADFGFEKAWRRPENAWWGSPVTVNEDRYDPGDGSETIAARVFTNAVILYRADGTTSVLE